MDKTNAPTNEPDPPTSHLAEAPIQVTLSLWRCFGLAEVVPGRPDQWTTKQFAGPKAGDELRLTLGAVPDGLLQAVTEWSSQASPRLNERVHGMDRQSSLKLYEQLLEGADTPHFDDQYPMSMTIRVTRQVSVPVLGTELHWAEDCPELMREVSDFERQGNVYLDAVVPHLIAPMWPMNFGRLLYAERRAFCTAKDRPAVMQPRFTLSVAEWGVRAVRTGGWPDVPTGTMTESMGRLPVGRTPGPLTAGAARCLLLALAEVDPLRRFVFAVAGLDVLATGVASKKREQLVARLQALEARAPVTELLWPEADRDRGLIFKIAAMAYLYSPDSALEDTRQARSILKFRNEMYHAARSDDDFLNPSIIAKELLRRYLGLVAATDGP